MVNYSVHGYYNRVTIVKPDSVIIPKYTIIKNR